MSVAFAGFLVDGQRLLVAFGGLCVAALPVPGPAEAGQRVGFYPPVTDLTGCGNGPPQVAGGLLITGLPVMGVPKAGQAVTLAGPVPDLAGNGEGALGKLSGLLVTA